jgi:peptidoglycan/LPS O-acetylase OafA/YrhL
VASECTLSAIWNLLNPLIVHWSLCAEFQQLLVFSIVARPVGISDGKQIVNSALWKTSACGTVRNGCAP